MSSSAALAQDAGERGARWSRAGPRQGSCALGGVGASRDARAVDVLEARGHLSWLVWFFLKKGAGSLTFRISL